tara:strand:- start:223 stop:963 length:741 start_codon:yes stop_codon:yes gene_type:complete
MDKKYFLFFSEAYKRLYSIYEFRSKVTEGNIKKKKYVIEKDERKAELLKNFKNSDNFNEIFNKLFEDNKMKNEEFDEGYGDWLKSEEDLHNDVEASSQKEMARMIEKKKSDLRTLVKRNDLDGNENKVISASNIVGIRLNDYGNSGMFSSLQYEDLKKAHTETVIPVTDEDYNNKKKFNSLEEIKLFRNSQDIKPLAMGESQDVLKTKHDYEMKNDMERAYKLAQQDKESDRVNEQWMKRFKQIRN